MKQIERQVGQYLEYCEKVRGMTEATMRAKKNVLGRFVAETEIENLGELTNEAFGVWMRCEMARGVSARSVNMYNTVVVAMVRYYRSMGLKVPLKIALVGKLKEGEVRRKYYTAEEVERVLAVADLERGLMIRMMFETGMRIAEVTNLRMKNIEGRRIRFIGKGRKPREVYIREKTRQLMEEYVQKYGVEDYLWGIHDDKVTCDGRPPTTNTVRNWLREVFCRAGYEGFYPHALRHSFATDLQMKGASVEEIKEMIGHESIATTERYLHGFEGRMRELFEKYE